MNKNKRKKILIVEDSRTQAEMLRYILEERGHHVDHRPDGKLAMELIREDPPDLVISDVLMPVMNGYELCKQIKSDPSLAQIPVLLLTSLADAEDVMIGLECGADSYLMKPYEKDMLLERVDGILSSLPSEAGAEKVQKYPIFFNGNKFTLKTSRAKILSMMISVYEAARQQNINLHQTQQELNAMKLSLEKRVEEQTAGLRNKVRERKEIEASAKASEAAYRGIVENALLGIFTAGPDGSIQYMNRAMLKLLGYDSREQLTGNRLPHLLESAECYDSIMEQLEKHHKIKDQALVLVGKDGTRKQVLMNLILNEHKLSGVVLDVTEKRELEEKDRRYREELKSAKEQAEASARQKSEFLSNLSHEVRTPLNTVVGFSSLLAEEGLEEEQRAVYLQHIDQSGRQLTRLINNVLELAKLEASKIQLMEERFNLNHMLDEICADLSRRTSASGGSQIEIKLSKGQKKPEFFIRGDELRLTQVLSILLDNAVKYTSNGGITFGYDLVDNDLQFFVKDSGIGIPPELKAMVFDRFQKADEKQQVMRSGLGIGLTIARKLVEQMDGEIWLTSAPGQGTEVFFRIPLTEASVRTRRPEPRKTKGRVRDLSGIRILVAEDNDMNFILLEAYLEQTGVKLIRARDGREALEKHSADMNYDVVLMDIHMPVMNGYEATEKIRKLDPEVPVIAVTAYSMAEEHDRVQNAGFADFLSKPVDQEKLIETILRFVPEEKIPAVE